MRNAIRLGLLAIGAAWLWLVFDQLAALNRAKVLTPPLFAPYLAEDYGGLRWTDLSPEAQRIWLTLEDPAFFEHSGLDFTSPGAGLTTITQSLVKRLYFEDFQPGYAKIAQTLIAMRVVDVQIPKTVQLDAALDLLYFGHQDGTPVIGFDAASMAYYGAQFERLSDAQVAGLVAMLPAPNRLKPGSAAHSERMSRVFRYLDGRCAPSGWRDVWLEGCAQSS